MSILFFDVDNTLLSHRTWTIPDSARKALEQVKENGHTLFLCSGRSVTGMAEYFDDRLFDGMVASSGARGVFHGSIVFDYPIDPADIENMREVAEKYQVGLFLQASEMNWMNEPGYWRMVRYLHNDEEALKKRGIQMMESYHGEPILKMDLFFTDVCDHSALLKEIPKGVETCVILSEFPEQSGCELTRRGVTKGTGVLEMMEYLGFDPKDSFGFGDSENDLPMMKQCGTGIAMGNASEQVRQEADYVTADIEEDGIYCALKHFGLF
jgi:Cof subfamily protein (haloacid dehalogenase superfamily)